MAVHVCSLPETHKEAIVSSQRPMAALLASLAAFFRYYSSLDLMDGILQFAPDGSSSEFKRRSERPRGTGPLSTSPWAELAILDPTREGLESLNLAPRLPPATQLLLAHELRRAGDRLAKIPKTLEVNFGESRAILQEAFEPLPEGTNALPSFVASGVGALILCGEVGKGNSIQRVEMGVIEAVEPRPGWNAPFLLRGDERSALTVRLYDVEVSQGLCHARKKPPLTVALCPCHFICRVHLEQDSRGLRIDKEGLERYVAMQGYIQELVARQQRFRDAAGKNAEDLTPKAEAANLEASCVSTGETAAAVAAAASPVRSRMI